MRHPSELCLFGDGTETRDFLNVDDFSEMVLELIERAPFQGESINIGTGTTLTIRQAAEIFAGSSVSQVRFDSWENLPLTIPVILSLTSVGSVNSRPVVRVTLRVEQRNSRNGSKKNCWN